MPDYGGYGSSWRKSLFHGSSLPVPEILHKIAGPSSTVKQRKYPALSGMGEDPYDIGYNIQIQVDDLLNLPDWAGPVQEPYVPTWEGPLQQATNYWPLVLIAGAFYLLSKKTRRVK